MTVHIALWWGIPLLVTIVAFCWAFVAEALDPDQSGIGTFLFVIAALIISLIAWLVGALSR